MHMALHPRGGVNRLYVPRKEVGRVFASIKNTVDASIQRPEDNIKMFGERLITGTRNNVDSKKSIWKKKWKKWEENNCKGISGYKQVKSYTIKIAHG